MSQEETPLPTPSPDFENKIAVAVDTIKQAAEELDKVDIPKETRDLLLDDFLSSRLTRRTNENLFRKSRGFWSTAAKVAGVAALIG
ncbi:hypothetical protein Bpfe_025321 [Biomphalaria pfeifferi]|uniref:Uncharacterized protein n=1 Tax=Biomphalaria pfeifferi TaxID=112525 RepID=A0AAD8AZN0_BIOPF|nr:hypothetical protein Bpfe_025321 [Biomphalaria pfeifferi]